MVFIWNIGLFVSPSGISDLCGTVGGMVTPKGSMSTEGETLQVSVVPYRCSICWLLRAPDKRFSHTLDSLGRWPWPASLFRSAQAATLLEFHVPLMNCFVRRWFCAVHGPKPPLHRHNWLSFGKFQDTLRFLINCARHFLSQLPLSGGTFKYAKAPSTKKTLRDSLPIDMLLFAVSVLVVAQLSSEVPEGLMNNPVYMLFTLLQYCDGMQIFLRWVWKITNMVMDQNVHIISQAEFSFLIVRYSRVCDLVPGMLGTWCFLDKGLFCNLSSVPKLYWKHNILHTNKCTVIL